MAQEERNLGEFNIHRVHQKQENQRKAASKIFNKFEEQMDGIMKTFRFSVNKLD